MFDHPFFAVFMLFVSLIHMIVLNDVKPKSGFMNEYNIEGAIQIKIGKGPLSEPIFGKIEDAKLQVYDDILYTSATSVNNYNIFNSGTKLQISDIQQDSLNSGVTGNLYGFNLSRPKIGSEPAVNIDVYLNTIDERKKWINAIRTSEDVSYGLNKDGSVVLNNIQTDIKTYLKKAKEHEATIYGDNSSPKQVKTATVELMKLKTRLDEQIKTYENPKTMNNILKGNIADVKDIKSCNCSLGRLRTLTMYLNAIVPSIIIILLVSRWYNMSTDSWLYQKFFGSTTNKYMSEFFELISSRFMIFIYVCFFVSATLYHGYLLANCRCAIPSQEQRGISLFLMLFFPILIIIQVLYKVKIK